MTHPTLDLTGRAALVTGASRGIGHAIAAELLAKSSGLPIDIIPRVPHEQMLCLHGQARVSIGLSISDALSTSALEAMVKGCS